jgi:hypothetical protein
MAVLKFILLSIYLVSTLIAGYVNAEALGVESKMLGCLLGFAYGGLAYFLAIKPACELIFVENKEHV